MQFNKHSYGYVYWIKAISWKNVSLVLGLTTILRRPLKILSDVRFNFDVQKLLVLVLLDLSTTFDAVDHQILLVSEVWWAS